MSIVHMVACGMVEIHEMTADNRRAVQQAAKFEAHSRGYWISGCKSANCCATMAPTSLVYRPIMERGGPHRLTRWNKKTFRNHQRPTLSERTKPIATGNFVECCKALVERIERITPSDPNPAE